METVDRPEDLGEPLLLDPEECMDVEQVREDQRSVALREGNTPGSLAVYALLGMLFGIVLIKSEVVSWFRIQEMFRFHSFHMYGIIGSAIAVAAASLVAIRALRLRTMHGETIVIPRKEWGGGTRFWAGGILFGLGWALIGACPGPLFALIGSGISVILVALASAVAGTWLYALVRPYLPH